MKEDVENAVVEFTNHAAKIYSWFFNQFRNSIRNINRRKEENVYKMQLAKYSFEFKKQMEEHMKLLTDSHPEIYKSVLSEKINYYLLAFWQKCLAL